MDRSLWLLLALRGTAWGRRFSRNVRSVKGLLLALVGGSVFVPMLLSLLLAPRFHTPAEAEGIRRYGALGLLAYCLLNVLLSAGDRAVYYSPAEVDFLFSGPYRPRQLLLYKVAAGVGAALLSTPFVTLALARHASLLPSALAGLFLALLFLYLFSIALGLVVTTVGTLAFTWGRRAVLAAVVGVLGYALVSAGREAARVGAGQWVDGLLGSPVVAVLLLPFEPFVRAFTAERVWPDLAVWSACSLLVDAVLLALVLMINTQFLEASAAVSARIYARIQRARRGEGLVASPARLLVPLPMPPWWFGVGPVVWRQATAASRSLTKLVGIAVLFLFPMTVVLFNPRPGDPGTGGGAPGLVVVLSLAVFAPTMLGFDFRTDLTRIENLKVLPIRPVFLALGQMLVPVLILSGIECAVLATLVALTGTSVTLAVTAMVLTPPVNLLLVAIENVYFLWYPFRMAGVNTLDFQAMGRQLLLVGAKLLTLGLAGGLAGSAGWLAWVATGGVWPAAVALAALVLLSAGLAMVPLVALAFEQFDVSQGLPE